MRVKYHNILLWLILIVAAFLRFYQYADWSLSNDELSALARLQYDGINEMLREGVKYLDFHPAGIQVFLWYYTNLFGFEVWIVRLPFVISGILSVYVLYKISVQWFNENAGLITAAVFTVLEYTVLYSQLARPYSPGLLFVLLSVWYWSKIVVQNRRSFLNFLWFSIFATLTAYTHHYSFLFIMLVSATGLLLVERKSVIRFLFSFLLIGLLYLPHLHIFLYQFGIGGVGGPDGWLSPPHNNWIIGYLRYAFNDSWVSFGVATGIALTGFVLNPRKTPGRMQYVAVLWFLASFLIGFFYSLYRNPILQYSILLFSFPFLIMFLYSFYPVKHKGLTSSLVLLILVLGVVQIVFINQFYKKQHFGEFRDVAKHIAAWNEELGKENVTNVIVVNNPYYIHYYLDSLADGISFKQYDNRGGDDLVELSKIVNASNTAYFIYAWTKPAPYEIESVILTKYPNKLTEKNYANLSAVSLYSRHGSDSAYTEPEPVSSFFNDFEDGQFWNGSEDRLDTATSRSGSVSYHFPKVSFAFGLFLEANEINNASFDQVKASLYVSSGDTLSGVYLVVSIEDEDGEIYYYKASQFSNFVSGHEWSPVFLHHYIPEVRSADDLIKIYIWNQKKRDFHIDDCSIEFYY